MKSKVIEKNTQNKLQLTLSEKEIYYLEQMIDFSYKNMKYIHAGEKIRYYQVGKDLIDSFRKFKNYNGKK